jgi:hypothetical protein
VNSRSVHSQLRASATFINHNGEIWRCVMGAYERNGAVAVKHKLVPVSGEMRIFDAADYRKKEWQDVAKRVQVPQAWRVAQSPQDKAREDGTPAGKKRANP